LSEKKLNVNTTSTSFLQVINNWLSTNVWGEKGSKKREEKSFWQTSPLHSLSVKV
jgi:hypothetical protein